MLARAPIPFSLADACVVESTGSDDPAARREVRGAIRETGSRGLATIHDDDTFDGCCIAFGIRNVTRIDTALAEMLRVLRPGGRLLCLEFSRPWAPVRPFYGFFSRAVIPRLGAWVSGNADAYEYLVESIRRFPDQEEFKTLLEDAGFREVSWKNFSFGISCLHIGIKADSG